MIVDAHAMAYRAYYALQGQNLTHPVTGQPTAAVFGFFRMLFKVLIEHDPELTAVTWDAPGGSFRNSLYGEYKAHRKPMPDDLRYQIDEIKELIRKSGFTILDESGFEADDLIGSLSRRFSKNHRVILLTGDKDCYQLLERRVHMLRPKKGVSEFTEIDESWVREELGIRADEVPDYMALVGDASDNIPGAKGVGEKTARKLIEEYHTIDRIYENIESITPPSLRDKLIQSRENVYMSKRLATINCDVESIQRLKDEQVHTPDFLSGDVLQLFRHEGYSGIYAELLKAREKRDKTEKADRSAPAPETGGDLFSSAEGARREGTPMELFRAKEHPHTPLDTEYTLVATLDDLRHRVKEYERFDLLAVDTETDSQDPMRARLVGVSMSHAARMGIYIALPPSDSPFAAEGIDLEEARPLLQRIFENHSIKKVGQNIKYDLLVLRRHGIELNGITFDTMIGSYLLNPNIRRHNLDDMALDRLGYETIQYEEVAGSGRNKTTLDKIEPSKIRDYACEDADIALRLYENLHKELKESGLDRINTEIEIPLIGVLADMEQAGVSIDLPYFKSLSDDFEKRLSDLERFIHDEVGHKFNISSTKELQSVLFEKLRLPRGRKTKTGYSTDQSVLEELRGMHPIVDSLLDHRKYSKLKSTYVDALPKLVHPETGRIHTSFNQTIAATGRLSSNEPNLQNIPIREETGRSIRRGFIARPGWELLSLDYSQIELRIMAHYSNDPALLDAFTKEGLDIHRRTASSLFGVPEEQVNQDQRAKAKIVNFSIIYGVTDFGLGQSLSIPRAEAKQYIDRFFAKYPGVQKYMEETIAFAEAKGYVQTLSGRRRQISEIDSPNRFRREGARRTAINTPVQGTSADIIKLAMIAIDADLRSLKLRSQMILQVHDELLFDVYPDEKDAVLTIAKSRMEHAMELSVPLHVDYRFGKNWDEAH
jgi:DNA polymerase-1